MNTTELKKLAEAATPGPWRSQLSSVKKCNRNIASHINAGESLPIGEDVKQGQANAAYIAAANPTTILELLAINAELVEALKEISTDYADRFDLESPSTNPGIKSSIAQARAALAKAEGGEL